MTKAQALRRIRQLVAANGCATLEAITLLADDTLKVGTAEFMAAYHAGMLTHRNRLAAWATKREAAEQAAEPMAMPSPELQAAEARIAELRSLADAGVSDANDAAEYAALVQAGRVLVMSPESRARQTLELRIAALAHELNEHPMDGTERTRKVDRLQALRAQLGALKVSASAHNPAPGQGTTNPPQREEE